MASRASELADLCRRHRVGLVYVFGSRAELGLKLLQGRGDGNLRLEDPLADLDVGVVMLDTLPPPGERYTFYADLYNSFGDLLPGIPLDLVLLQENHAVFQAEAITGHCVYAATEDFRSDYEQRILARAADFRPVLEAFYRDRLEEAGL